MSPSIRPAPSRLQPLAKPSPTALSAPVSRFFSEQPHVVAVVQPRVEVKTRVFAEANQHGRVEHRAISYLSFDSVDTSSFQGLFTFLAVLRRNDKIREASGLSRGEILRIPTHCGPEPERFLFLKQQLKTIINTLNRAGFLKYASFSSCHFFELNLNGLDLTFARFTSSCFTECSFSDSIFYGCEFAHTLFDVCNFTHALFPKTRFTGGKVLTPIGFKFAYFSESNIHTTTFINEKNEVDLETSLEFAILCRSDAKYVR